jgi:hypothetical protein
MLSRLVRPIAAAAALAAAGSAAAYVLPATAILRLAAKKRAGAAPAAAELRGTFTTGATAPAPAALYVKAGRCRFELLTPDRPHAVVRAGRVAAQRGLEAFPGAAALAEGACALLAPAGPEGWTQALGAHGVAAQEVALGRLGGRVAYVLGGRAADPRPQAWFDKVALHPLRLVADLGGARRDVLLLEYPQPPAPSKEEKAPPPPAPGDAFPRAVEVHREGALEARFAVDRVTPNPRVPDSIF